MLTSALKKGKHEDFFVMWDQYIMKKGASGIGKRDALSYQEMEFHVNIQFAIQPYLNAGNSGVVDRVIVIGFC